MQSTTSTDSSSVTAATAATTATAATAATAVSLPYVPTYISPYNKVVSPHTDLLQSWSNQSFMILVENQLRNACKTNDFTTIHRLQQDPRASLTITRDHTIQDRVMNCLNNDPTVTAYDVFSAFHTACEHGNTEIVDKLMKDKRLDPSSLFNKSLKSACEYGFVDIVGILLKDARVKPTESSNAVLHLALKCGQNDVVECLLKEPGVDATIVTMEKEEPKYKFHYNYDWLLSRIRQILAAIPEVSANAEKARMDLDAKIVEKFGDTPLSLENQEKVDKVLRKLTEVEASYIQKLEKEAVDTENAMEALPTISASYHTMLEEIDPVFGVGPIQTNTVAYAIAAASAASAATATACY